MVFKPAQPIYTSRSSKHVNLAARIGGSATGGEILVSSLLAQLVGPSGEFTLSERPAMSLKGLDGKHVTHVVAWK